MSVHVSCGGGGAYSFGALLPVELAKLDWSETLDSGDVSANSAGSDTPAYGRKILTLTAFNEAQWAAIGPDPDASEDPRRYLADGQTIQVAAEPGDKVACAEVS